MTYREFYFSSNDHIGKLVRFKFKQKRSGQEWTTERVNMGQRFWQFPLKKDSLIEIVGCEYV